MKGTKKRVFPLAQVYRLLESGPVVLVTTTRAGRANIMPMSWHTMMEFEPYGQKTHVPLNPGIQTSDIGLTRGCTRKRFMAAGGRELNPGRTEGLHTRITVPPRANPCQTAPEL